MYAQKIWMSLTLIASTIIYSQAFAPDSDIELDLQFLNVVKYHLSLSVFLIERICFTLMDVVLQHMWPCGHKLRCKAELVILLKCECKAPYGCSRTCLSSFLIDTLKLKNVLNCSLSLLGQLAELYCLCGIYD